MDQIIERGCGLNMHKEEMTRSRIRSCGSRISCSAVRWTIRMSGSTTSIGVILNVSNTGPSSSWNGKGTGSYCNRQRSRLSPGGDFLSN